MTDFIREVDEEVRQDKFKTVLNRYWYVIAALVVLILGGVGAWKAYDYYTTQKAETAGGIYLNALDASRDGKTDEAIAALRRVETEGTPGYRLLARFRIAGETAAKDPNAAAQMFDAIGADPTVDPSLQLVAKLRGALLLVDKLPYPELKQRLAPLADPVSPVRNAAREMLALAALKANDFTEAGVQLEAIGNDATAGGPLRQRAQTLLGLVHGAGTAPATPVSAPAASSTPAAASPDVPSAVSAPPATPAAPVETPATPVAPSATLPPSQAPAP